MMALETKKQYDSIAYKKQSLLNGIRKDLEPIKRCIKEIKRCLFYNKNKRKHLAMIKHYPSELTINNYNKSPMKSITFDINNLLTTKNKEIFDKVTKWLENNKEILMDESNISDDDNMNLHGIDNVGNYPFIYFMTDSVAEERAKTSDSVAANQTTTVEIPPISTVSTSIQEKHLDDLEENILDGETSKLLLQNGDKNPQLTLLFEKLRRKVPSVESDEKSIDLQQETIRYIEEKRLLKDKTDIIFSDNEKLKLLKEFNNYDNVDVYFDLANRGALANLYYKNFFYINKDGVPKFKDSIHENQSIETITSDELKTGEEPLDWVKDQNLFIYNDEEYDELFDIDGMDDLVAMVARFGIHDEWTDVSTISTIVSSKEPIVEEVISTPSELECEYRLEKDFITHSKTDAMVNRIFKGMQENNRDLEENEFDDFDKRSVISWKLVKRRVIQQMDLKERKSLPNIKDLDDDGAQETPQLNEFIEYLKKSLGNDLVKALVQVLLYRPNNKPIQLLIETLRHLIQVKQKEKEFDEIYRKVLLQINEFYVKKNYWPRRFYLWDDPMESTEISESSEEFIESEYSYTWNESLYTKYKKYKPLAIDFFTGCTISSESPVSIKSSTSEISWISFYTQLTETSSPSTPGISNTIEFLEPEYYESISISSNEDDEYNEMLKKLKLYPSGYAMSPENPLPFGTVDYKKLFKSTITTTATLLKEKFDGESSNEDVDRYELNRQTEHICEDGLTAPDISIFAEDLFLPNAIITKMSIVDGQEEDIGKHYNSSEDIDEVYIIDEAGYYMNDHEEQ